eukprot:TRINITY_DN17725_c0_g2_i1.p1 TRINITY_DN17725_c0_g2~~TRINITY_DN17725_c0_g2_i1.p1  ORF type:complete len:321 (+),score=32.58 TRINITY_DN17725_c0_g2_i1:43-1005(+)
MTSTAKFEESDVAIVRDSEHGVNSCDLNIPSPSQIPIPIRILQGSDGDGREGTVVPSSPHLAEATRSASFSFGVRGSQSSSAAAAPCDRGFSMLWASAAAYTDDAPSMQTLWKSRQEERTDSTGSNAGEAIEDAESYNSRGKQEAEVADSGLEGSDNCTLMVKNIPVFYTEHMFEQELQSTKFGTLYVSVYMPKRRGGLYNRGYVFVRFCSREAASMFADEWRGHRLTMFENSTASRRRPLAISRAHREGFEDQDPYGEFGTDDHVGIAAASSHQHSVVRDSMLQDPGADQRRWCTLVGDFAPDGMHNALQSPGPYFSYQ